MYVIIILKAFKGDIMNILLVYPKHPVTYWSFHYALKFISKKAGYPPLGLLTVAAMLPEEWNKKLVDLNVETLSDKDIAWADYVFISAMVVQRDSVREIVERCKRLGVKTAAGGPLFTTEYEQYNDIDHLILNEGEITIPRFIEDIKAGCPAHIYTSDKWANMEDIPIPLWNLVNIKKYASMNIQYSRGCPFNCDFCNITTLYGRVPRTKSKEQLIEELESIYAIGWRNAVFFVDDNFIGNKKKLKTEILPAIIEWQIERNYPFTFYTEASVNLADDEELMHAMVKSGFTSVFVGIETPNEESLAECSKFQNTNRDLIESIKKIQRAGLEVQGGFIVGFDSDPDTIFEKVISFIQESGIVTAMVGLLNAPKGTSLYHRLMNEGRLIKDITGNNTDLSINFIPKMNYDSLIEGYKSIVSTIYSPRQYYERVMTFLRNHRPFRTGKVRIKGNEINAFLKSIFILGVIGRERVYYWKLFFWSLLKMPKAFPHAIAFSIYGFHFRKIFENY
jgi:radical SAM superfamily enzyme YgiQ (UPF0313 family)